MLKTRIMLKALSLLTVGGAMMTVGGGCLPDNFWAGKWGEIVNRSIMFAIAKLVDPAGATF